MELNWKEAPAFGRRETLLGALRRLHALCPGPVRIVETGTLRNDSPTGMTGDGWSTVAWAWYCSQVGGTVHTVDIDAGNLDVCRRATAPFAAVLDYVHADSLDFLRKWADERRGAIHMLYLDSFDYVDRAASEAHHLAEAEAALPALADHCLVLIDDTSRVGDANGGDLPVFTGKGARAVPFLLAHGFRIEWVAGGQVLLSRGAGMPAVRGSEAVPGDGGGRRG